MFTMRNLIILSLRLDGTDVFQPAGTTLDRNSKW